MKLFTLIALSLFTMQSFAETILYVRCFEQNLMDPHTNQIHIDGSVQFDEAELVKNKKVLATSKLEIRYGWRERFSISPSGTLRTEAFDDMKTFRFIGKQEFERMNGVKVVLPASRIYEGSYQSGKIPYYDNVISKIDCEFSRKPFERVRNETH